MLMLQSMKFAWLQIQRAPSQLAQLGHFPHLKREKAAEEHARVVWTLTISMTCA